MTGSNSSKVLLYNFYLLVAAVLWGMNFHFAKFMLQESQFLESATWRYIFGVVPLIIISYKSLVSIKLNSLPIRGIVLVGFVGLFGFNVFFFWGLMYTTAINAALIMGLNPITTLGLSALLLKTKLTRYHILGAMISLIGVLYLLSGGNFQSLSLNSLNVGDLLILVANLLFALHHIWVKLYRGQIPNDYFTAITNIICLAGFLALLFLGQSEFTLIHSTRFWISAIGIGGFGTALAYILWNEGVYRIGADSAGTFLNIVPLSTAIFAFFLGEELYLFHFVSGILIVLGIIITKRSA